MQQFPSTQQLEHPAVRDSHSFSADLDDPSLVSTAGLLPVVGPAEEAGLHELVATRLSLPGPAGANAAAKMPALVAGMVAGADSIGDVGLLRHAGMGRLFTGVRAPITLGTHLRAYTVGHVRQLDAVASRLLAGLTGRVPSLPAGAGQIACLDVDDTIRSTYGHAKQGAGYGYNRVKDLNAPPATLSTGTAAPVIAAIRLRRGSAASAHGSPRLIVRRVRRLNPATAPAGQHELLTAHRHHAVFTDSPLTMLAAEASHRDHAIVELVIADLKNGSLAHLP